MTSYDEKLLWVELASVSGSFEDSVSHCGVLTFRSNFVDLEVGIKHKEGCFVGKTVGLSTLIVAFSCRNIPNDETLVK